MRYAQTKGWELGDVTVDVDYDHQSTPRRFQTVIRLGGDLSDFQLERLHKVAAACPFGGRSKPGSSSPSASKRDAWPRSARRRLVRQTLLGVPGESPGRTEAETRAAVEEAEGVDAAREADERVDRPRTTASACSQSGTPTSALRAGSMVPQGEDRESRSLQVLRHRPSGEYTARSVYVTGWPAVSAFCWLEASAPATA